MAIALIKSISTTDYCVKKKKILAFFFLIVFLGQSPNSALNRSVGTSFRFRGSAKNVSKIIK
ncbi:hypothetical protein PACTADRAFT_140426 [Pachysolen tannophilus NRRL Y-2460]|uniref:Uncharacterized protein n=1 Tax=Pachysolen tannophilus NRRL Y-2460 TaxID=669874 RepID=A0A1E4U0X2_PACTA|nr:hypothetical protein PACTADRAFT_140426 [Pachysolen tannophilus NRRL Y-2460]